jgi:hypothetical protein
MRIKQICGSKAALINPLLLKNSKNKLRKLLQKTNKVHVIKMKFKRTHQLLMNMRLTFENSIDSNRAKLLYMLLAYKKEIDNFRTEIAKSKDKNNKHLIKPLTNMEKTAPIKLFKEILYRCKVMHSLAFFQWRYHNVSSANQEELEAIFKDKIDFMKGNVMPLPPI